MTKISNHFFIGILSAAIFLLLPGSILANYTTNMNASIVIGQPDFTQGGLNHEGAVDDRGLNIPEGIILVGNKMIVSDCMNNRILIYNSIPTSNFPRADVVIGQPNMFENTANQNLAHAEANTLHCPLDIDSDGTQLFVSDWLNNRVLIYHTIPTNNNASADVVIGQPNMQSGSTNQGLGHPEAYTLSQPAAVSYDPGYNKLFISDLGNSRILIYNSVPTSNNASAHVVVGQPDFVTKQTAVSASRFEISGKAIVASGKMIFPDFQNNRVLIFNQIPTSNNASADVVIGQETMTGASINQGLSVNANTLYTPQEVASDGTRLFIQDANNHRILIYNTIPTSNNASADIVLGQADFTHNDINQGLGHPEANTLYEPNQGMFLTDTHLFTTDTQNHRILIYTDPNPPKKVLQVSSSPNPNYHEGWKESIMAGPHYIGMASFISNNSKAPGTAVLIESDSLKEDISIAFETKNMNSFKNDSGEDLPFPWAQGLNTVSEISHIKAVSAFNGYPVEESAKPFMLKLLYDPARLSGLSTDVLRTAYYDNEKKRWTTVKSPMVIDKASYTISTTTTRFGLYAVVYPASVWQ